VSERLSELLDRNALCAELGVTRACAEAIMCKVPTVHLEDFAKVYVRRDDVHRYLDERTFEKDQVPR
jgi:hypothetical protein